MSAEKFHLRDSSRPQTVSFDEMIGSPGGAPMELLPAFGGGVIISSTGQGADEARLEGLWVCHFQAVSDCLKTSLHATGTTTKHYRTCTQELLNEQIHFSVFFRLISFQKILTIFRLSTKLFMQP